MIRMFVLKESKDGKKFEFFDLNTQENGKFVLYSVKKTFTASTKGYFK